MKYSFKNLYTGDIYEDGKLIDKEAWLLYFEDEDMFMRINDYLTYFFEPLSMKLTPLEKEKYKYLYNSSMLPYGDIIKGICIDEDSIKEIGNTKKR